MNAASSTAHFDVFKQEAGAFYESFPELRMLLGNEMMRSNSNDAVVFSTSGYQQNGGRKQKSEYVTEAGPYVDKVYGC